jgi:hypothetical protein
MSKSGILTKKQWQESVNQMWSDSVKDAYKDLLEKAILEEREACAKVCEEAHWSLDDRNEYAAAIRARGNNGT